MTGNTNGIIVLDNLCQSNVVAMHPAKNTQAYRLSDILTIQPAYCGSH